MTERETKVLKALAAAHDSYCGFSYLSFRSIAKRSRLPLACIRRTVRCLARKGFAEYGRGLFTEDGDLAGSGYCITQAALRSLTGGL